MPSFDHVHHVLHISSTNTLILSTSHFLFSTYLPVAQKVKRTPSCFHILLVLCSSLTLGRSTNFPPFSGHCIAWLLKCTVTLLLSTPTPEFQLHTSPPAPNVPKSIGCSAISLSHFDFASDLQPISVQYIYFLLYQSLYLLLLLNIFQLACFTTVCTFLLLTCFSSIVQAAPQPHIFIITCSLSRFTDSFLNHSNDCCFHASYCHQCQLLRHTKYVNPWLF